MKKVIIKTIIVVICIVLVVLALVAYGQYSKYNSEIIRTEKYVKTERYDVFEGGLIETDEANYELLTIDYRRDGNINITWEGVAGLSVHDVSFVDEKTATYDAAKKTTHMGGIHKFIFNDGYVDLLIDDELKERYTLVRED